MTKPLREWLQMTDQGEYANLQTQFFRIGTPAYVAWLDELTGTDAYSSLYQRMLAVYPPQTYATVGQAVWTAFLLLANDPPVSEEVIDAQARMRLGYDIIQYLLVDAFRIAGRRKEAKPDIS